MVNVIKLLFIFLCLGIIQTAHAEKVYRCNGRVTPFPCKSSNPVPIPKIAKLPQKNIDAFAIVKKPVLEIDKNKRGHWRGWIEGNGTIKLTLVIHRQGIIEDERYIGTVRLVNKETWFHFVSNLPAGGDWSWEVTAVAS